MPTFFHPGPSVIAPACACLIFVALRQPSLVVATLLQVTTCACLLGLLFLLIVWRSEIRRIVAAACQVFAALLLALLPPVEPAATPHSVPSLPAAPLRAMLFQRPPPLCA